VVTEVDAWLESLGLGEHAEAFAENGVTRDLLLDLTNEDLKDLGIARLADRKALLKAIAALGEPAPTPRQEAERRQITVMFCDLVGSTALAEALDPEELRGVMQAYQSAAGGIIERYGGHVAQYLGDGLMTYFGWPQAHEDDAERAVRASLDIVEAINAMDLQVRVGIATGPVVVGETGAGDASVPKLAVGETPNLAARVQGLASPDDIVAADSTRRLLGAVFTLDDLGAHSLKGIVEPVQAWRVADIAAAEGRLTAVRGSHLTAFVGREAELALLAEKWEQAKAGEGQLVLLSGESGIGKSRLAQAIRERAIADGAMASLYQCSPYHTNTAFHPISDYVARDAGFSSDDPAAIKLERIDAHVRRMGLVVDEVAPLIAAALAVPSGERYPALDISPQMQKARTVEALADALIVAAEQAPLLFLVEDMHWSDPSSLETATRAVERLRDKPILALFTFRPEFTPPWKHLDTATSLALGRMGRDRVRELVDRVSGGKPLPEEVEAEIIAKTDGVPLFVEELTKTVLESGVVEERDDAWALTGPLTSLAIPSTLHDSLMARLDRLGPVKEVAQIGACIGREFSHALLATVSPLDDSALQESLFQLIDAELIFTTGSPSEINYTFKHALVQDVAYESMLKSKRHAVHGAIADILVDRFPDLIDRQPEILALHLTEAGRAEPAVAAWLNAGERATARSAHAEAIAHLQQGLALLREQTPGGDRDRRELTFQVALGNAHMLISGYTSTAAKDAFGKALELCRDLGNPPQVFPVLYGLSVNLGIRGELPQAQVFAKEFVAEAETQGDLAASIVSHRILGTYLATTGELAPARRHLEHALGLYDERMQTSLTRDYGHDPRVWALSYLSQTLWLLGYFEQAHELIRQSLARADDLALPPNLVSAKFAASRLYFMDRNRKAAFAAADGMLATATEHGFPNWAAYANAMRGWARAELGDISQGLDEALEGIAWCRVGGSEMFLPICLCAYATACRLAGRLDESRQAIAEALEVAQRTHELWYAAELHRMQGEWSMADGECDAATAEAEFRRAIEIAQSQDAKAWELRAATSLARLWHSQGKSAEARDLLAPVHAWFTEGFDSADMQAARTLLDALDI
jgi:class 3 adenylate cyclase/predicted ATPase